MSVAAGGLAAAPTVNGFWQPAQLNSAPAALPEMSFFWPQLHSYRAPCGCVFDSPVVSVL